MSPKDRGVEGPGVTTRLPQFRWTGLTPPSRHPQPRIVGALENMFWVFEGGTSDVGRKSFTSVQLETPNVRVFVCAGRDDGDVGGRRSSTSGGPGETGPVWEVDRSVETTLGDSKRLSSTVGGSGLLTRPPESENRSHFKTRPTSRPAG